MTDALPSSAPWEGYHDGLLFNTAEADSEFLLHSKHKQHTQPQQPHPLQPYTEPMECVIPQDQSQSSSLFSPSHAHHLSTSHSHASASDRSPLSHSRSSSPFSSSHTSTSHPLDSPVHHQAQWVDPTDLMAGGGGAESEGESSLHSGGSAHQSGVSTPFAHLHTPQAQSQQQQQQQPLPASHILSPMPPNLLMHLQQGGGVHPMMLPTINEHLALARPQPLKPSGASATNLLFDPSHLNDSDDLPELHLPAPQPQHMQMMLHLQMQQQQSQHIGMLPSSMMQDAMEPAAVTSPTSQGDRVCVRAKRRTRYTTAAAASVAARASLSGGAVTEPSPAPPAQQPENHGRSSSYMSGSASGQSSDGDDAEADAQKDEQEQEGGEVDEDDDSYSGNSTNAKKSKRKRGGSTAKSAAAGSSQGDSPQLKGLDKRERNKLSASMYRKRRKVYLDSLEGKVGELDETISKQGDTISKMAAENKALKEQLSFFKRMVAQINPGLVSTTASQAQHQQPEQPQASNVHYGAQRNARGGQLASFMMVVVSCILLLSSGGFFVVDQSAVAPAGSPSAASSASAPAAYDFGAGPAGRKLLSVDHLESVAVDASGYSSSAATVLSASPLDAEVAAALNNLVLADNSEEDVARFNATLLAMEKQQQAEESLTAVTP